MKLRKVVLGMALACALTGCNGAESGTDDETKKTTVSDEKDKDIDKDKDKDKDKETAEETTTEEIKETEEVKVPENNEKTSEYDMNLWSTWGLVAHYGDTTYFYDFDDSNLDDIKYFIYSISDEKGATPELIYTLNPEDFGYESFSQAEAFGWMNCYEDKLYFIMYNRRNNVDICWISLDGKESGRIGSVETIILQATAMYQVNGKLYFNGFKYPEGLGEDYDEQPEYIMYEVDLKNETIDEFNPAINEEEGHSYIMLAVDEENAYFGSFVEWADEMEGIFSYNLATGGQRKVCGPPKDTEYILLAGNYIYYECDDIVYSVDKNTGETYELFEDVDIDDGYMTVANDVVYYLVDGYDLYSCTPKGEDKKLLVDDMNDSMEKYLLGVGGDWLFFMEDDTSAEGFIRMKKDADIFPEKAMISKK